MQRQGIITSIGSEKESLAPCRSGWGSWDMDSTIEGASGQGIYAYIWDLKLPNGVKYILAFWDAQRGFDTANSTKSSENYGLKHL